jgi:hypothetical protein
LSAVVAALGNVRDVEYLEFKVIENEPTFLNHLAIPSPENCGKGVWVNLRHLY